MTWSTVTSWPAARSPRSAGSTASTIDEQIADEDDHAAPRDEPRRLPERGGEVGCAAAAGLGERGDDAPPLRRARARRDAGADGVVEADQADRVALAQEQERERGGELLGVGALGEASAAGAPRQSMERLTSRTMVARRLVSSSYCLTTQRSARAAIFQST